MTTTISAQNIVTQDIIADTATLSNSTAGSRVFFRANTQFNANVSVTVPRTTGNTLSSTYLTNEQDGINITGDLTIPVEKLYPWFSTGGTTYSRIKIQAFNLRSGNTQPLYVRVISGGTEITTGYTGSFESGTASSTALTYWPIATAPAVNSIRNLIVDIALINPSAGTYSYRCQGHVEGGTGFCGLGYLSLGSGAIDEIVFSGGSTLNNYTAYNLTYSVQEAS